MPSSKFHSSLEEITEIHQNPNPDEINETEIPMISIYNLIFDYIIYLYSR